MQKVIIDTDPGLGTREADFDDGVALLLALKSPQIDVIGITTVHGNVPVSYGTRNVLRLLHLMQRNVKVAQGAHRPIILDYPGKVKRPDREIEGIFQFIPSMEDNLISTFAPQFIVDTANKSEDKIIIVGIGPLTNIALSLIINPGIKEKIEKIIIMGGAAFYPGNVTPVAEFNIWMDPEAAEVVFSSGLPIVMVGLNVTQKIGFTKKDFSLLKNKIDPLSKLFYLSAVTWLDYLRKMQNTRECYIHDALAVGYLLDEKLISTRQAYVSIETKGALTRGQTVIDTQGISGKRPNAQVCMEIDKKRFREMVIDCLEKL